MVRIYNQTGYFCISSRRHNHFGIGFVYGFVFNFTIPLMLFGVYRPNDLPFETYLKYRFHYELTVPDRTFTGRKGDQREKIKTLNETKDLF